MSAARRDLLRLEVPLGVLGLSLVGLAIAFALTGIPGWILPALSLRLGVASPLTGMTRSFVALARGDIVGSVGWHPLGPLVVGACVASVAVAVVSLVRGQRLWWLAKLLRRRALWAGVGAAFAVVWLRQALVVGV